MDHWKLWEKKTGVKVNYISFPVVIFARKEVAFVGRLKDLFIKRVAVVEGYLSHEKIKKNYPDRPYSFS